MWSGFKDLSKTDHIKKVRCGPELRIHLNQTTEKNNLWSAFLNMQKTDHKTEKNSGPHLKKSNMRTTN